MFVSDVWREDDRERATVFLGSRCRIGFDGTFLVRALNRFVFLGFFVLHVRCVHGNVGSIGDSGSCRRGCRYLICRAGLVAW